MKVALFVEGSNGSVSREGVDYFTRLWIETIPAALGLRSIDFVFPINKKHILSLDPNYPKMSGSGEPLDELIARKLFATPFDAAIVAWDLLPAWLAASARPCRWAETLDHYRYLSASTALPPAWALNAANKYRELSQRQNPSARLAPPTLLNRHIYAACMDAVFESMLLSSEHAVRSALGVTGLYVPDWPATWKPSQEQRPEITLLQKGILAARKIRPAIKAPRIVSGDMRTAKHEWAVQLINCYSANAAAKAALLNNHIARRLMELLV